MTNFNRACPSTSEFRPHQETASHLENLIVFIRHLKNVANAGCDTSIIYPSTEGTTRCKLQCLALNLPELNIAEYNRIQKHSESSPRKVIPRLLKGLLSFELFGKIVVSHRIHRRTSILHRIHFLESRTSSESESESNDIIINTTWFD